MALIVMGLASGAFSAISGATGASAANNAANQAYMNDSLQTGINNGREQIKATQMFVNQLRRNKEIRRSAYNKEWDDLKIARVDMTSRQSQMSSAFRQKRASIVANQAVRNVGGGSSAAIRMAQITALVQENDNLMQTYNNSVANIRKQRDNAMKQITTNIYLPNYAMIAPPPMQQSVIAPIIGGVMSGATAAISGGMQQAEYNSWAGSDAGVASGAMQIPSFFG